MDDTEVQVLGARDVPLGGPRAMTVRRTLPQRSRTLIGAWCFADHYGPDEVAESGGMDVAPHPHTGLQTVSWLFSGEIEHRDSLGSHAFVRPGELNLMTGGHGISHTEVSTPGTTVLHGVQLWVALPGEHRHADRDFQHHAPQPVRLEGAELRVFLGSLAGEASPVPTFTPLLGAEILLAPGATVTLPVDPAFEHGLLLDEGTVRLGGTPAAPGRTRLRPHGARHPDPDERVRPPRAGGPPGRHAVRRGDRHVVELHRPQSRGHRRGQGGVGRASERFGHVDGYPGARLPAPALPNAALTPRGNPPRA